MNPYQKILEILDESGADYELLEHEPVMTSEEAAEVRGMDLATGAKSLMLETDDGFVLVVVPGDRKFDNQKLRNYLGTSRLQFADPDEVEEQMGCEVGACYPFGNIAGLRTIADEALADQEIISFNIGRKDRSVKMSWEDFQKLANPEVAEIS